MSETPVTVLGRATPGDCYRVEFTTRDGDAISTLEDSVEVELTRIGADARFLSMKFEFVDRDQVIAVNRDLPDGRVQVLLLYPRAPGLHETDQTLYIRSAEPLTRAFDESHR